VLHCLDKGLSELPMPLLLPYLLQLQEKLPKQGLLQQLLAREMQQQQQVQQLLLWLLRDRSLEHQLLQELRGAALTALWC
jgi:hypothetical protein